MINKQTNNIMENYTKAITEILTSGNYNLNTEQDQIIGKISEAIDYAWNNWDDDVVRSSFTGEKPEHPTEEFVRQWIENEDFEADGYDIDRLKEIFG